MINLQEETYTIQEVAEMTDLSAHTLRYYEKIGLLESVTRHENGHRRYAEADLGWIHFLKLLRATGMPIQQMQLFMEFARQGDGTIADRVEVLTEHRRELAAAHRGTARSSGAPGSQDCLLQRPLNQPASGTV
jgi:DNA-binding transcriptional MerR regulator